MNTYKYYLEGKHIISINAFNKREANKQLISSLEVVTIDNYSCLFDKYQNHSVEFLLLLQTIRDGVEVDVGSVVNKLKKLYGKYVVETEVSKLLSYHEWEDALLSNYDSFEELQDYTSNIE